MKTILATGADIKNRFLIAKDKNLHFGPDIGDLNSASNYEWFKKELKIAIKSVKPNIIICDLHPGYFSTKLAKERGTVKEVQHHHAHIASVMQEYGLTKPVIGVSFDGTGLGTDGNIWGGEFLFVDRKGFKRLAHFKYLKMPGGDKVVTEPWRMVLSILGKKGVSLIKNVGKEKKEVILSMMSRGINSPLTSSAGRLFDAAAALLGICTHASYEAEGPIKLEEMCEKQIKESYRFKVSKEKNQYIIDPEPVFLEMVKDLRNKKRLPFIATKFHNSITNIIIEIVKKLSKDTRVCDIALSGGVFQNRYLKENVTRKMSLGKFNIFANNKTPINDFNISLGQYYVSCGTCKN